VQEKPVQKKYGKALAEQAQEIDADTVVSGVVRWYQVTPRVVETGAFGVVRARYGARGELGERVKVRPVSAQGREIVNTELKAVRSPAVELSSYSLDPRLSKLYLHVNGTGRPYPQEPMC
jgi:hypothetical protein